MANPGNTLQSERFGSPPLVGRDPELQTLRQTLRLTLSGSGRLVLVSGEAGIGKTSLVQQLVADAQEQNALVLSGAAYDLSATPPYGPWLELTDRFPDDPDLPDLPEILKRGTGVGNLKTQPELFAFIRDFFVQVSTARPLVLVLEDLHWSDHASLELLRYFARYLDGQRILLVVSYRDDEISRRHPLFALLPSLIRESQATRMELGALSRDDLTTLISCSWSLTEEDRGRLLDYLLSHAEGQPLFTVELLRTLEQEGFISKANDGWQLADLTQVPVPALVRQVIEGRLVQLGEEARHHLQVSAVIGHHVPLDLWQSVACMSDEAILDVTDQAVALNLMEPSRNGTDLRFVHAVTREVLYESISPPWRRNWHTRIAESLACAPNPDPDAVAYHFQRSRDQRAVEWLVRAGERAQATYAWEAAVAHFDEAAKLMDGDTSRTFERIGLLFRLGRLVRWSDPQRGVAYLEAARKLSATIADAGTNAFVLTNLGLLRCYSGDIRQGIDELAAGSNALEQLTDYERKQAFSLIEWEVDALPGAHVNIETLSNRGTLAGWLAVAGRYPEAVEVAEKVILKETGRQFQGLPVSKRLVDTYQAADACHALGTAYARLGRPRESGIAFKFALDFYNEIGQYGLVAATLMNLAKEYTLPYQADQPHARKNVFAEIERALDQGRSALASEFETRIAYLYDLFLDGDWSGVQDLVDSCRTRFLQFWSRNLDGQIAHYQGTHELGWESVSRRLPDGPATEPGDQIFPAIVDAQRLAAALSLDEGDLERAQSWLEAHDRWLDWSGSVLGQSEGSLLWAQLHLARGDDEAALNSADLALEWASDPEQPMALIAVRRFLGELSARGGDLDGAQQHLDQSLELAETCQIPFERALTLLAKAELAASNGNLSNARSLLSEVRRIGSNLGAMPMLERAEHLASRLQPRQADPCFGLSPREREVLQLLAQGMSDKEIANELFISPHTVMRHVSSILRKLDAGSRTSAVAFAVSHDLT